MLTVAIFLLYCKGCRGLGLSAAGLPGNGLGGRAYAGIHFPLDMAGALFVALAASGLLLWQRQLLAPLTTLCTLLFLLFSKGPAGHGIDYG